MIEFILILYALANFLLFLSIVESFYWYWQLLEKRDFRVKHLAGALLFFPTCALFLVIYLAANAVLLLAVAIMTAAEFLGESRVFRAVSDLMNARLFQNRKGS